MSGEIRYFALGFLSAVLLPLIGAGVFYAGLVPPGHIKETPLTTSLFEEHDIGDDPSLPISSDSERVSQTGAGEDGHTTSLVDTTDPTDMSGSMMDHAHSDLTGATVSDPVGVLRDEIERAAWMMKVRSTSGVLFPDFGMMLTEYDAQVTGITKEMLSEYDRRIAPYRAHISEIRARDSARRVAWREALVAELPDLSSRPSPYPSIYSLIEIDISEQKLYAYEDGELIMATQITSGKRGHGTIQGMFAVGKKQTKKLLVSPFADDPYRLWVDYWIPFAGAYGIHDACNSKNCWRTQFGGMDYQTRGSHGCVNTPYEGVRFLYDWAVGGTSVYVHE